MNISFIGPGTMGQGMALNLVKAGHQLCVIARKRESLAPFEALNIDVATDISAAANSQLVFLCLPDYTAVKSVLLSDHGLLNLLKPGSVIVDFSTIGYLQAVELSKLCTEKGMEYLDAPVSGQKVKADAGTLTIMCGGKKETFDFVKPLLDNMGTTVLYMGESGSGQLTKMINNCVFNICVASFCELMPLGVKLGLDAEKLAEVIVNSTGSSYAAKSLLPGVLKGDFTGSFTLQKAYKDMLNMSNTTAEYAVPLPTLNGAMQSYQLALQNGQGDLYKGALIRFYEQMLGVECREENI